MTIFSHLEKRTINAAPYIYIYIYNLHCINKHNKKGLKCKPYQKNHLSLNARGPAAITYT